MINLLLGAAAIVTIVLSLFSLGQSTAGQGSVAEVRDGGTIVLNTTDGKTQTIIASDLHTKIVVDGQEEPLAAIKAGMTCAVTGADKAEAAELACN